MGESLTIPVSLAAGGAIPRGSLMILSTGTLVVSTGATTVPVAVAQDTYASGDIVAGVTHGYCYMAAHDGAIAVGDRLEPAAAGRVDTHAGTAANTVVGIAWEASAAQDDLILCQFIGPGIYDGT